MTAYYNEHDKFAAAWLRELIKADLIAPGEVDERSIEDVQPEDIRGFTQCHFFAGVGTWSYALRNAGWGDNDAVWSGSCPCPPFSSAGKSKACPQCDGTNPVPHVGRTGFFVCCLCDHEWFADARHLWPELWRLISVCRPVTFFGEQVAGGDGKTWLALVRASLEILGYAVGAKDLCSAGFGASDIRQRLYFVADPNSAERRRRRSSETGAKLRALKRPQRFREASNVDKPNGSGSQPGRKASATVGYGSPVESASGVSELADAERGGLKARQSSGPRPEAALSRGVTGELAHTDSVESGNGELQRGGRLVQPSENPLAGFWANAEWIYCRDDKWRAVESKYVKVVDGLTGRVGSVCGQSSKEKTEEVNAQTEVNGDGQGSLRDLQQDQVQVARSPQGSESREQRSEQLTDFMRLLPSSLALAQLHGDTVTAEALLALLKTCGAEGAVRYTPNEIEKAWRSTSKEIQDRLWVGITEGGFVRTCEFPLAHGATNRVGRLRGYGNAINAEVAKSFIEAYMETVGSRKES